MSEKEEVLAEFGVGVYQLDGEGVEGVGANLDLLTLQRACDGCGVNGNPGDRQGFTIFVRVVGGYIATSKPNVRFCSQTFCC
jgi:hypothetical protein